MYSVEADSARLMLPPSFSRAHNLILSCLREGASWYLEGRSGPVDMTTDGVIC